MDHTHIFYIQNCFTRLFRLETSAGRENHVQRTNFRSVLTIKVLKVLLGVDLSEKLTRLTSVSKQRSSRVKSNVSTWTGISMFMTTLYSRKLFQLIQIFCKGGGVQAMYKTIQYWVN